jgi:membrane glycosyltransferase
MYPQPFKRTVNLTWYICLLLILPMIITAVVTSLINWSTTNILYTYFWLFLFYLLNINLSYCLLSSLIVFFTKPNLLKDRQTNTNNEFNAGPIALAYCVKNEGDVLEKTILQSVTNNNEIETLDIWIISNSNDKQYINYEKNLIADLNKTLGSERAFWFAGNPPKHIGFNEWLKQNTNYKYCLMSDADTLWPAKSIEKLIRKAGHPSNRDVAIFQSRIYTHDNNSIFSAFLSFGQEVSQRLYTTANSRIFDNGVFYGSGALIKCNYFRQIHIPKHVLSHDIWETAYLQNAGFRTVNCEDIITYEHFPKSFLEMIKREIRWTKGSLQSFYALFLPNISTSMRLNILHPIYNYIAQPIFALWLITGIINQQTLIPGVKLIVFTNEKYLFYIFLFVIAVLILHRWIIIKNLNDLKNSIYEAFFSTLLYLNGVIYATLGVLNTLFQINNKEWQPTNKGKSQVSLLDSIKMFWLSSLIGLILLYLFLFQRFTALAFSLPLIISFTLSVPLAYATSQEISKEDLNNFYTVTFSFFNFFILMFTKFISRHFMILLAIISILAIASLSLNFNTIAYEAMYKMADLKARCPKSVTLGEKYDCQFKIPKNGRFPIINTRYIDVLPLLNYYINTEQENGTIYSSSSPRCLNEITKQYIEITCTDIPTDNYKGVLKTGRSDIFVGVEIPKNLKSSLSQDETLGWYKIWHIYIK